MKLRNDFIVPFYGITIDPLTNTKCMVMKYCINGNLCSFLEKNHSTLNWSERYRLSIEIAKGLEFLHKSGFHHRDLHSGNILLDDKRTAMICDFGLSRSSTKGKTNDITAAVGVASFLAPERFPRERPIYSAACDIYSLGVIFWHISSGRIPFAKRLRDPALLQELMIGQREEIAPGTPKEFKELLVKCWDRVPAKRLKIDVVIAVLQTLMAKPSEPIHQVATGFEVPSSTYSSALPVPPELRSRMATLERATNTLNKMVFNIKDPAMQETVSYIDRTRAFFREQRVPVEPYSQSNPPKTPIYLCPLVGDLAALHYYLSNGRYNPINESSAKTGDTALHLACLFLESPLDTIKVLVELGADINRENLQGYTPLMILVSSNTQQCFESLKYFVMRGTRIPAYIRNPITPLNSAQIYALNLVNETRQSPGSTPSAAHRAMLQLAQQNSPGGGVNSSCEESVGTSAGSTNKNRTRQGSSTHLSGSGSGAVDNRMLFRGRPLMHVVAAMQEDSRILDCLCEAGLDPAMSFGGDTALVAAAAHLRIRNVQWLLNNDLDISSEAGVQRAIEVVKMLHLPYANLVPPMPSPTSPTSPATSTSFDIAVGMEPSSSRMASQGLPEHLRDLSKYSWAGVAYGDYYSTDGMGGVSRDMVGPVLHLLEQWTGFRRISLRREVATKLKVMYGPRAIPGLESVAREGGGSSSNLQREGRSARSLRKSQRHLIDHVLLDNRW
ncbi:hypothetical protein BGW38_002046 [Lunasporangiospora selenospora]|uniref:Protein kinase domain-containing protein n=1 Tax=Lunasporangiospora selenospora TaxID=979761 RepID=A0A9P6FSL3_9FUNG|nr:hypothetical protein BGW38_002046 [Lunasporangiospora selenospora]